MTYTTDAAQDVWKLHVDEVLRITEHDKLPNLPIVKITEYTSVYDVFEVARTIQRRSIRRFMTGVHTFEGIGEVKGAWYYITRVPVPGQELRKPNMNLRCVLTPQYRADKLIVIELGCTHNMVVTKEGRCYTSARCLECGYSYATDSGD